MSPAKKFILRSDSFLLYFSLIFQTHVIERLLFSHASLLIFLSLGVCQWQLLLVTFLCGYFVMSLYIDEKITFVWYLSVKLF